MVLGATKAVSRIACLALMFGLVAGPLAQSVAASSPQLNIILPRGVQRGGERVLNFHGARLSDVEEVLFYTPDGFQVGNLEVVNDGHVKATVTIAEDCRVGEHVVQLRARSGISEFRTFFVEAYPQVDEAEDNGSIEQAQAVGLNSIVAGVVQNEDVDYYAVELKQGQRLAAEIFAIRLGNTLFDPYIAILDNKRFELSGDDDTPLARQDAVASIVAPEDGTYYVQVRESSYGGNGNCRYRLCVGSFPRPTAAYPAGGKLGETLDVRFLGDPAGELVQAVTVPTEPSTDFAVFPQDAGGMAPSPVVFRPSEFGNVLEQEPNNTLKEACPAELPNAFNGVISEPGDIDCFRFTATQGQVFDVECFARRIRSGLDPVMNIYHGDGRGIAGNDDSRGPDSYFRFTAPADGEYIVRVTDHLQRGQEDFVYRIEFLPVKPQLSLGIPRVDRYSQYRQSIFVPRGNRFATLISATRANFGGEIVVDDSQLPDGITMYAQPMAANLNVMPVVFEASADAEIGGKLITLEGRHADESTNIRGIYENRADLVLGPPNNALYYPLDVQQIAVAVVDEVPFELEIVQPQAPIVRDGSMQLKIVAHRKEGFNEAINIQFPFRPPGIGAASSVNIPANQNEVVYPLSANGNAQVREWPIYVIGSSNVGGAAWVASQLATLQVAEPYVTVAPNRASTEQGKPAQVFCTLNQVHEFEGEAVAQLLGLPPNTTAEPMKFTKDMTELTFNVTTAADSPVGNHKNIIVRVTVTTNGEPVISRAGATEFQIDKPLPAEQPAAQPQPQPQAQAQAQAAPQEPPQRPLTRLEKLRQAAKQRREAENGESSQ